MQRFLIKCVNCALLVIILIGIPAITHIQVGRWGISSVPIARELTFWGLALATIANVLGATIFAFGSKAKALCAEWTFIFGGLLFLEYAAVRGWIHFDWLKNLLERL